MYSLTFLIYSRLENRVDPPTGDFTARHEEPGRASLMYPLTFLILFQVRELRADPSAGDPAARHEEP
jgi:hypothetical protein